MACIFYNKPYVFFHVPKRIILLPVFMQKMSCMTILTGACEWVREAILPSMGVRRGESLS